MSSSTTENDYYFILLLYMYNNNIIILPNFFSPKSLLSTTPRSDANVQRHVCYRLARYRLGNSAEYRVFRYLLDEPGFLYSRQISIRRALNNVFLTVCVV